MIIETESTLSVALFLRTDAADIAPVIVAEKKGHIVWGCKTSIIITLHFCIDCPELRNSRRILAIHLADDVTLTVHHILQGLDILCIIALTHCYIAIATHTDGHEVIVHFITIHTLIEEAVDSSTVGNIIPWSHLLATFAILMVRTHHWLMMRGPHHDAILIGKIRIHRVILIEVTAPHGRPQVVGLQTQQEFEHVGIHLRIVSTEMGTSPSTERRFLIIDKDTTILHLRRRLHVSTFLDIERGRMLGRHVSPPIPRRYAYLL